MKKIYLALILIFVYLILINFVGAFVQSYPNEIITQENKTESGAVQEFNFGSSVSWQITRPRIYGTIYENGKESKLCVLENLNILKSNPTFRCLIPLPLKSSNISMIKFHLIFVALLAFFIYRKKETKKISSATPINMRRLDFP